MRIHFRLWNRCEDELLLFPTRYAHARYSSRMIDRFLNLGWKAEKRQDQRPLPAPPVQDEKIEIPQTLSHQSHLETILENTRLSSFDFIFSKIINF